MTNSAAEESYDGRSHLVEFHQTEAPSEFFSQSSRPTIDTEKVAGDQKNNQEPAYLDNKEVGKTNSGGHLTIPQLDSVVPNHGRSNIVKKLNQPRSKRSKLAGSSQDTVDIVETSHVIPITLSRRENMNPARLFVASLGNPPPYATTRHSAGHVLIKALQSQLMFPPFQKSRVYGGGLTSFGADIGRPEFTLWQSPSLMNVSGVALLKAYKAFASASQTSPTDPLPGLMVIYDEMETTPSQLRLRRGATSAKGHNGLKSVQQTLQAAGLLNKLDDRYIKIGIGIGRPAGGSRSSDDVSKYVLGQLTSGERQAIDNKVGDLIGMLEAEVARLST